MASGGQGGLESVVAGETALCTIDGQKGELRYRGYDAAELARRSTFEEVCWLLWHGELPTKAELDQMRSELADHRRLPREVEELVANLPRRSHPMDVCRTVTSLLAHADPDVSKMDPEANLRKAIRLTAQLPVAVAAFERWRSGREPLEPRVELSHAGSFLQLLTGEVPLPGDERIFDTCLVLHMEHGFNVSTFTARVVASSLSDLHSCVTAAIGSLKGPLHGGANERVLDTLRSVGDVSRVESFVAEALARKDRIMGFGHRVYRVLDPRAVVLKELATGLSEAHGDEPLLAISERLEATMAEQKGIYPNVDFYSASTYAALGIPKDLFTPIFVMARVVGWTAHVFEQLANNRLIRPRSNYTGYGPREFVPIERR